MTSKSFLRSHPHPDRVQRQMTFLIPPPQVEDHLGTDSDPTKSLLSTILVWSQLVVNMSVPLASSPRFGTFALVKEFYIWHTAKVCE